MTHKYHISTCLLTLFCAFAFGQSSEEKVAPKLRLGVQTGYGYRIAPMSETNDPVLYGHLLQLKFCWSFGADFSYYFANNIGVGIKYNANVAHALTNDISYTFADGTKNYDYLSELVDIHYIAPFLAVQVFTKPNKQCFFANIGAGYVRYSDNAVLYKSFIIPVKKEVANSAAFFVEIGYDFFVSKSLAIGLQSSLLIGGFKNEKRSNFENLSHVDISLGFRFYNL
jgi:outer membrane protein W